MINSRKITDLLPEVQKKCEKLISICADKGIDLIVTSTYRDFESQAMLYAQGRTLPGKKVTNARPGMSYHNYRVAFDVVPVQNGKAIWNDDALWDIVGEAGECIGLTWGGSWDSFKDKPHFQYTNKSLTDLIKEYPNGLS